MDQVSDEEAGLDLVEISPNAKPPVCRIMDHGKFLFELNKKKGAAKKKQKQVQIKEIKLFIKEDFELSDWAKKELKKSRLESTSVSHKDILKKYAS